MSKAIDLNPYGLQWVFDPDTMMAGPVPGDYAKRIQAITRKPGGILEGTKNTYTLGKELGHGTYGTVFEATRKSDGKIMVVKEFTGESPYNVIKETIINIIVVETTKDIKYPQISLEGPFAPRIYDFGVDPITGRCYIMSEQMRNTIHSALRNGAADPNFLNAFFKTVLLQLSWILTDLSKLLRFNHRDFKTDNCMYVRSASGHIHLRIIDFGFSCIQYDGVFIDGGGYHFKVCRAPTRDMSQFLYEMYTYHPYLPARIKQLIEDLLTFPVEKQVCKMYTGCKGIKTWRNTYGFLNSRTLVNPNCQPEVLKEIAGAFYADRPWQPLLKYDAAKIAIPVPVAKPAVPVACPPGKVYNPNTTRCVSATGAVGRRLRAAAAVAAPEVGPAAIGVKACPADKPDYNPKSKRCLKACPAGSTRNATTFKCKKTAAAAPAVKAVEVVKPCPPGQPDRNPKTKRCVKSCPPGSKRNAATFKCKKETVAKPAKAVKAVKPVKADKAFKAPKPCPPGQPDRNPKTKRCVKSCPPGKRRNAATFKCVK